MKLFEKYPSCFGKLCLGDLCAVAWRHGMLITTASKPDMHCYNEIGLYGTSEQMKAVVVEWEASGNKLKPHSFTAVMGVHHPPVSKWIGIPTAHREWCTYPKHKSRYHCDFDPNLSRESIAKLEAIRERLAKREK